MALTESIIKKIFKKACLSRAFEEELFERVSRKEIKIPVYMSAGQEFISATLAVFLENLSANERQIFIQHRGHSTYLSFGGLLDKLIYEILGDKRGCAGGMGGSASIQCRENNIFGHDGMMGSHGPISVGACYGNKKFTLCFAGDAAAEEDYFLAAIGWASTKKLPIWFIVEDNNLSILTEKRVRRCWEMHDIAHSFKMKAFDCTDNPDDLWSVLEQSSIEEPLLLNVRTNRLFWHAGAGIDSEETPDLLKKWLEHNDKEIFEMERKKVRTVWEMCLKHLEKP
jgi:TPP-dependent pyruvate/acetoin dehydrogenase alpha subunit